jgi:hypothetical protein
VGQYIRGCAISSEAVLSAGCSISSFTTASHVSIFEPLEEAVLSAALLQLALTKLLLSAVLLHLELTRGFGLRLKLLSDFKSGEGGGERECVYIYTHVCV